jgi:transcriptional regulator with XRE-family HTH domain
MNVGRTLRQARRRARLSQRALAARTGIAQPTIARIESGDHSPRLATLEALLDACGESLEALPRAGDGVDRTLIRALLALSPAERVATLPAEAAFLDRLAARVESDAVAYDPVRALQTLTEHGVRFVLVGGVAGRLWGSPSLTSDTDVCCADDPENLGRLAAALSSLHARLRGVDGEVPFVLDARALATAQTVTFTTDAGALDVLTAPAGTRGFADLDANAERFGLGEGLVVRVCALDDLIRMNRAAGRPKDRVELEVLAAVREALDDASD